MDTWTGVLIDPTILTTTSVTIPADWQQIAPLIGADLFAVVRLDDQHFAYVDDEGLYKGPHAIATMLQDYPEPLMGKVLILAGTDDGETVSATWTVDDVKARMDFVTFGRTRDGVIVAVPIDRKKPAKVVR
jgi:hypothetical protein